MKRLLALLIGCSCLNAKSIVTDELVDKFAIIESNYNHEAVGDGGKALGAWQMHKAAVYESVNRLYRNTGNNFSDCGMTWNKETLFDPLKSRMIAKAYMLILEEQMHKLKVEVTPIKLYMAWNMGFSGARSNGFSITSFWLDSKRVSILRRANYILSR
jgi:hypothetical protein